MKPRSRVPPEIRRGEKPRYIRFFFPLAIQAASQALSYPLVAMVASRGPGGPVNLAGLAQANTIMFFLGMFAIYYVTTGLVFAKTREGFQKFRQVTLLTGLAAVGLQAALSVPSVSHFLFSELIGLPAAIEQPARITLLASIPLQFLFFARIPYFVVMYQKKAAGRASLATIGRILFTAALSPLFCLRGWVGPVWAVACLTLPVAFETLLCILFAAPYRRGLPPAADEAPRGRDIFLFNLPLSAGGYFLSLSAVILGAFMARAADPVRTLPAYYLALGLANPLAFAATRLQTLVLVYPPREPSDRSTLRFAAAAGAVLGMLPLLFILPGLAELYYVKLQRLNPADLALVRATALSLISFPFSVAIRAQSEGLAAWKHRPLSVMSGHACFMAAVILSGFAALEMGIPGHFIGAAGLTLGSLTSSAMIRLTLRRTREKATPIGQTTTSIGQIR
jgi:hypothetical protein